MPRKPVDYPITPVSFYHFVCNDPNIISCYVGHTTQFIKRKSKHKLACNSEKNIRYNCKVYRFMRENGGFDNFRMIELENRLVKDKREAERIEQEYINKLNSELNTKLAFGGKSKQDYTQKYYKEHIEQYKQQGQKDYGKIENGEDPHESKIDSLEGR